MKTDPNHCPVCRVQWADNLLSTQVSFALGALCVFVPMFPAMIAQQNAIREARTTAAENRREVWEYRAKNPDNLP